MRQELKRLARLAGCGALLCGGLVLAEDAAPAVAPAAPAAAAPAKREGNTAFKELRTQIEAKEKAVLEKNAELKAAVDALDAQIKAKRAEGTPDARTAAREISKQRQEKLAAADPELKDLYAKQSELMKQQFGNRGGAKPAEAKPETKPAQ
jgi:hypothetical protein